MNKKERQTQGARSAVRCVSAVLLLFVIAFGLNIHLFFLQVWGWSGMMLDYRNETGSWGQAASMTFGGEAPCNVCRNVDTALQAIETSTDQPHATAESRTLNWLLVLPVKVPPVLPPAPPILWIAGPLPEEPSGVVFPPDSPPPRIQAS
ncbi:MAG: hypothetical protein WD490_01405 [Opitutales bacterium]